MAFYVNAGTMHSGNRCITLLKANLKLREHVPFPFPFKNCVCFGISEMVKVSCVPGENSGGGGSIVSFYCVVVFISAFLSLLFSHAGKHVGGKNSRREMEMGRGKLWKHAGELNSRLCFPVGPLLRFGSPRIYDVFLSDSAGLCIRF